VLGTVVRAEIIPAIRALPTSYRLTVYLADVKGLSYQQVTDLTGIPARTVKSSLHRARRQLRAGLAAPCPVRDQ
jgi:RNA polymerase sigma-70 factor (ECF subfamily)